MSFFTDIKYTLQRQGKLTLLIIVNVVVFLIANLSVNIMHVNLVPYLGLSGLPEEYIYKLWTLITYMFTHTQVMHVIFNLILLYFSGQIFYSLLGEKRLLYVYIMSGVFGGGFFLLLGLMAPQLLSGHYLIGASAAVMGIVGVVALYAPNLPVNVFMMFEMPYKYFALLIFVLSTVIDFAVNTGGKISHIGGIAFGIVYGYYLKNGNDLFNLSVLPKNKLRIVHNSKQTTTKSGQSDEVQLDFLLDKISKGGYDSLTKKEKEDLFKLSQKK